MRQGGEVPATALEIYISPIQIYISAIEIYISAGLPQHAAAACAPKRGDAFRRVVPAQAVVRVGRAKLLSLLLGGAVLELKWAATIALALLRT